jgi:hypothetical protein
MGKTTKEAKLVDHIRRCHHCNHVTSLMNQEVRRCESCYKTFVPFFFFNLSESVPVDELGPFFSMRAGKKDNYQAIYGLSLYWDHE